MRRVKVRQEDTNVPTCAENGDISAMQKSSFPSASPACSDDADIVKDLGVEIGCDRGHAWRRPRTSSSIFGLSRGLPDNNCRYYNETGVAPHVSHAVLDVREGGRENGRFPQERNKARVWTGRR